MNEPSNAVRPSACPGLLRIVRALDGGICRIKLAGGELTAAQAEAVADAALRHAAGVIETTNRANLQIRGIGTQQHALVDLLLAAGLGPREAAGDDVRNLMLSPSAGIDPQQIVDVRPLAAQILHSLETRPRLHALSAKFAVQLDGGEGLAMLEHPHDLWLSAFEADGQVWLAFGLAGCPGRDRALGAVAFDQGHELVMAVLERFLEVAGPEQSRMRELFANPTGPIAGRARSHSRDHTAPMHPGHPRSHSGDHTAPMHPGHPRSHSGDHTALMHPGHPRSHQGGQADPMHPGHLRSPVGAGSARDGVLPDTPQAFADTLGLPIHPAPCERAPATFKLGIQPQLQPGLSFIATLAPLGRLTPAMLRGAARLAREHGDGTVRITPWQGLLLPNLVRPQAVLAQLTALGFITAAEQPLAALIACTGSAGCAKGLADTKADARLLAQRLPNRQPLSVHLSGCARSCASAHVAPATLLATSPGHYDLYARDASQPGFGALQARHLSLDAAAHLLRGCSRSDTHD
ncbi:precorrin-3B synthase [Pseudomonas sp. UBA4194]|uniref:precorrin-3B synthase n=1 Tax=Pseudomonas sp. UBA4194 TaxID=1947317 RepID=UPI0025D0F5B8|nr:precorrin-3B synthase [Pseudomonas sp. UBA4194]